MISLKTQAIQTALKGDWEKAVGINKTLIKEDPLDIDALNRLAFAFTILGKIKDAKSVYQKVLKIDLLNPLALRNIKKLNGKNKLSASVSSGGLKVNNTFIEEQGKTKIVELVNIAQPSVINTLRTGQMLELSIKRLKIFVLVQDGKYVGVLPDNIGKRLIKFMNSGNQYEAYIKSASEHHLIVFLREIKRATRLKDQPSFLSVFDKSLELDRKLNKPPRTDENDDQGPDDE